MKKHYALDDKLKIIDIAKTNGISKTAELYKISRTTLRTWITNDENGNLIRKKQAVRRGILVMQS